MDIWKVFIKLSAGLPLSVDLTVTFKEDWTSKSKLLVEFNSSSSIKNGRPAVCPYECISKCLSVCHLVGKIETHKKEVFGKTLPFRNDIEE